MPQTPRANPHDVFLDLLRELRASKGITQQELALEVGFRQADVSKVERGVRRLDVLELRDWAVALGSTFPAFAAELDSRLSNLEALQRHSKRKPERL